MTFVLDTCVVVAGVRSKAGASSLLLRWASAGVLPIALTVPLAMEYEDVLFRPENRVFAQSEQDLNLLIDLLFSHARQVRPRFSHRPCLDDPGDELVLEAAIAAGGADIVTFNVRDFVPAVRFGVRVYRPGELVRILKEKGYGEE